LEDFILLDPLPTNGLLKVSSISQLVFDSLVWRTCGACVTLRPVWLVLLFLFEPFCDGLA
jgi:hypothetical protein